MGGLGIEPYLALLRLRSKLALNSSRPERSPNPESLTPNLSP